LIQKSLLHWELPVVRRGKKWRAQLPGLVISHPSRHNIPQRSILGETATDGLRLAQSRVTEFLYDHAQSRETENEEVQGPRDGRRLPANRSRFGTAGRRVRCNDTICPCGITVQNDGADDPEQHRGTADTALDSSFKFTINDNLLLAGVTADATDKTVEILQGVVSAGLSVAKVAAMAGDGTKPPMDKVANRLKAINEQIAKLAMESDPNGNEPKKMARLDALLKEQQTWLSVVAQEEEITTVVDGMACFSAVPDFPQAESRERPII